jgi:hypothetical protein
MTMASVSVDDLHELELRVQDALQSGDDSSLQVLGYGEVTLVLRLETDRGAFACKRLPTFPSRERFNRYAGSLAEYLSRLAAGGLHVAPTELHHLPMPRERVVGYCVQEVLPPERLASRLLAEQNDASATDLFERFFATVQRAVSPTLGLDGQAANWMDVDGQLRYLDVTTPLMRDARGRERLDVRLFFRSLPWALRDAARVSMSSSIFEKFYTTRGVVLDFLGNLHKERLQRLVPGFIEQANRHLREPLTAAEVAAYYRDDARLWEIVQRLRKADRLWQRRVRRRPYPFLLPPDVAR